MLRNIVEAPVDKSQHKHKQQANTAENKHVESNSDNENVRLVVPHAMTNHLKTATWIIGGTCHMCNDQ